MCLIAHRSASRKKGGSNIPNNVIDYNFRRNPDGFGMAWRETDGSIRHEKFAPKDADSFRYLLKEVDSDPSVEYAAHWRLATHGAPCKELSHPFVYEDEEVGDVFVFHNGIIPMQTPSGESDTRHFVNTILTKVEPMWWTNPAMKYLIEEAIGSSRMLVMSSETTVRLNQRAWVKSGGLWYSTDPLPTYGSKGRTYGRPYYYDARYGTGWTDDDDQEEGAVASGAKEVRVIQPAKAAATTSGWFHPAGASTHYVKSITMETDSEGDKFGTAECTSCRTMGEVYVIAGKVYIDVAHEVSDNKALVRVSA